MSCKTFTLSTSHLEDSHKEQFDDSLRHHGNKKFGPTPQVRKTKSKVQLNNGTRFLNNPYYAGTPLASVARNHNNNNNNKNNNNNQNNNNQNNNSAIALAVLAQQQQHQPQFFQQPTQPIQPLGFFVPSFPPNNNNNNNIANEEQQRHDSSFIFSNQNQPQQQQQHHNNAKVQPASLLFFQDQTAAINNDSFNHPAFVQPQQPATATRSNSFVCVGGGVGAGYVQNKNHHHHNNQQQQENGNDNFSFTSQQFATASSGSLVFNNNNNNNQQQQQPQQPQHHQRRQSSSSSSITPIPHHQLTNGSSSRSSAEAGDSPHDVDDEDAYFNGLDDNNFEQENTANGTKTGKGARSRGSNNSYPSGTCFAVVAFKHELCTFQCMFFVAEGDWVVVQADRGEHVGRVRSISATAPPFHVPSHILRHANFAEISSIEANHAHEEYAAKRIQEISQDLQLPLRITDTEFYSDGNKMTVFFSSKSSVDFRELQRRVFREFRRRIWLINNSEVQYRNRNNRNRK